MHRIILLSLSVLLLASCHYLEHRAEQEKQQDQRVCIRQGYSEGSTGFTQCMERLDAERAQRDIRKMQQDIDEYERLKQDRLEQHLHNPNIR